MLGEFSKLLSSALILCIGLTEAKFATGNQTDFKLFDFERIKTDLFLDTNLSDPSRVSVFNSQNSRQDNEECSKRFDEIQKGLISFEDWAMKLLDAWGKIPSSILEGNLYEFGGFSECFHIKRTDEVYKTQYCMGNLVMNFEGTAKPKSDRYQPNNFPFLNVLQANDDPLIEQRMAGNLKISITLGMCLPVSCSTDIVESKINNAIPEKLRQRIWIKIPSNTCQFEEIPSELKVLDIVTLSILGTVLVLVLASTGYDILYTLLNKNKTEICLAFSFYTNGLKILSIKKSKSPDVMDCIHGIRAISTQWVVLGHTFVMYIMLPIRNATAMSEFATKYHNMVILSAVISVDTFFLLSGLFASMAMLKLLEKSKGRMNIPLLYLHRYLRLTPLLVVSVLFSMSLLRFLGSGPLYPTMLKAFFGQCEKYWWSTLLYVQNYVNPSEMCFNASWYLSVDMQLFWIAPILVYMIYFFGGKALFILSFAIFGCIGGIVATYLTNDIVGLGLKTEDLTYRQTHLRFSPWLIGLIAGSLFFKARKNSIRIPRMFNLFAWILSLVLMTIAVFSNYPLQQPNTKHTNLEFALYESLSRVAWSIALCYIIFACINNYGGPVNWFLGHPVWQPLSRLSYAIYIVHISVITVTQTTLKTSPYFSELNAYQMFLGNFVLSVFVAIIASLSFESPFIIIEKFIFGPRKKLQQNSARQNVQEKET